MEIGALFTWMAKKRGSLPSNKSANNENYGELVNVLF